MLLLNKTSNSSIVFISFSAFLGILTWRGPLAGMVDLSDVRSMSRPCSPLSVFPIPCIMRPVEEQATKHTYTLECYPHSSENTNARVAVVVVKGNHPGRQAPSTSKARVDNRGTNKQLIQPTLVSLSVPDSRFALFQFPSVFFLPVFSPLIY